MTVRSGCSKKKCSDFDGSGTSRLESIKCGANLVSDEKVDFSRKTDCHEIVVFYLAQPHLALGAKAYVASLREQQRRKVSFRVDDDETPRDHSEHHSAPVDDDY